MSTEKVFRIFFYIWFGIWGVINLVQLIAQYASFNFVFNQNNDSDLGIWFMTTIANVLTIFFGIVVFVKMLSIPSDIKNGKFIKNISFYTIMAICYYLAYTIIQILAVALFKADDLFRQTIFLTAWLFPSFIILIFHVVYFQNVREHNLSLDQKSNN
jgi:hypothetical protein